VELNFGKGYIPDIPDVRDFRARALIYAAQPLPGTYRVDPNTIIYDQDGKPKCVASAACGVKTAQEFIQNSKRYKFDDDQLYAECKKRDGIPGQAGTYPRVACQVLKDIGVPLAVPTCSLNFLKPNKPQPNNDSSLWRIKAYYRITPDSDIELIKQILFQYGSILCGSNFYATWEGKFSVFPAPGSVFVPHAYKIDGWDQIGFIMVNSWGPFLWGVNGVATMPFQMFLDYVLPEGDIWKLIDA
jgi:hypothetical protein